MSKRLFSADEDKQIAMDYRAGNSSTRIARRLGCDKSAVLNALRRCGVAIRDSGKAKQLEAESRRTEILALYKDGYSLWAIKGALGLQHTNPIARILREAGIVIERRLMTGERHHMWKGGFHDNALGYRMIRLDRLDPFFVLTNTSGYALEHRVVMSRALGRPLRDEESVHHIDGNRLNNELSNLQLRQGKHGGGVVFKCCDCGSHNVQAVALATGDT